MSNQKLIDFCVFLLVFLGIAPETPPRCPKTPQDVPRTRQEASKRCKIRFKTAPKTRQDTPKTPPGTPRPLQDGPKSHPRRPKTPQNAGKKRSKAIRSAIPSKSRFWSVLGWILDRFRVDFRRFLGLILKAWGSSFPGL